MLKCRREIAFDLDFQKLVKQFGKRYSKAYDMINDFFCNKNNFEHRQQSVYCSTAEIDNIKVVLLIKELSNLYPWFKIIVKQLDVTEIGNLHDLTYLLKQ